MDWPFLKHYADCTFPGPSSSPFPRHCDKCSAALTLVVGRAFLLGAYPPAVCVCVRSACSQGMQCCTSFILAHYSLELLYIHPESTQFSNWWEFCSLFPGIATLTNLHYLFLKPSLYWLWFLCHFYLIIWFVNYWTLYSWWKVPLPSLSLECSFEFVFGSGWICRVSHTHSDAPWPSAHVHGGIPLVCDCQQFAPAKLLRSVFACPHCEWAKWLKCARPQPHLYLPSWGSY